MAGAGSDEIAPRAVVNDAQPQPPAPDPAPRADAPDAPDARRVLRVVALVGLLGALYAIYGIWVNPRRPHVTTPLGYYGNVDQSYYLVTARVLAKWRLPVNPRQYFYGLGYPVVGALFTKLGFRGDPFAPADVLLFGGICSMTFVLAGRMCEVVFGAYNRAVGAVAVAVLAFGSPLFPFIVTPFNSTVVVFSWLAIFVLLTARGPVTWRRGLAIGLLLGWIFATRYGDAAFAGLPVAVAVFVVTRRERGRLLIGAGLGFATIVAVVLYTQYHAFGNAFTTPYHFHTRLAPGLGNDQSLKNYRLHWIPTHFVGEFVTARLGDVRVGADPILRRFPLLPFAPLGAGVLVWRAGRMRAVWIATLVASVASTLFYLAFIAGGAGDLVFDNPRYWALWYPLWTILAVLGAAALLQLASGRRPFPTRDRAR